MTDFNIRHLIRDVLRSSTMADPSDVAEEVMKRVPKNMMRVALSQVLREVVRQVMSEERKSTGLAVSEAARVSPPLPIRPAPAEPMFEEPARIPNRSWKVTGVRDGWQKRLMDRIHVGEGARDWKLLKFCSYEDLLFAANERRGLADKNAAMARQFDAWARLVNEHNVATFGDLPVEAMLDALGRAA